jgi:hypothetical protein
MFQGDEWVTPQQAAKTSKKPPAKAKPKAKAKARRLFEERVDKPNELDPKDIRDAMMESNDSFATSRLASMRRSLVQLAKDYEETSRPVLVQFWLTYDLLEPSTKSEICFYKVVDVKRDERRWPTIRLAPLTHKLREKLLDRWPRYRHVEKANICAGKGEIAIFARLPLVEMQRPWHGYVRGVPSSVSQPSPGGGFGQYDRPFYEVRLRETRQVAYPNELPTELTLRRTVDMRSPMRAKPDGAVRIALADDGRAFFFKTVKKASAWMKRHGYQLVQKEKNVELWRMP